jgi:hypothetical protein
VVASGTPAFTVIEADAPEARIGVATARGGTIARGDRLPVTVEGATYPAVVRTVLPVRDLSARTVDVLLTLDADWGLVNEGDLARLTLDEAVQRRGTWLPISSLTESVRGLFAVYAVVDDGKGGLVVERREVSLDHQTADRAFVTGGFSDGTRIVTSGVHKLSPGMAVRITGPDGDGEAPAGKREDRSKDQRGETIASGSARG